MSSVAENDKEEMHILISFNLYSPLLGLDHFPVSWSYTQSVGLLGQGDQPDKGPVPIPVFERAKTVDALGRAATVKGKSICKVKGEVVPVLN
jgi:hypothetical protein